LAAACRAASTGEKGATTRRCKHASGAQRRAGAAWCAARAPDGGLPSGRRSARARGAWAGAGRGACRGVGPRPKMAPPRLQRLGRWALAESPSRRVGRANRDAWTRARRAATTRCARQAEVVKGWLARGRLPASALRHAAQRFPNGWTVGAQRGPTESEQSPFPLGFFRPFARDGHMSNTIETR